MITFEGKIKNTIFYNESNGYIVASFRVYKTNDPKYQEYVKKSITITGSILDVKLETTMLITGEFANHEKFGWQFKISSYEFITPTEKEDVIAFLCSSFIKGCGQKTAEKIVDMYGNKSIDIIKENKFALDKIEGMNDRKRDKIYESIINYSKSSDLILELKKLGFSIEEAGMIYTKYHDTLEDILNNNIYLLNEIIDFKRLDAIFLNNNNDKLDKRRVKACIIEVMHLISLNTGDIYYYKEDIFEYLNKLFHISIDYVLYMSYLKELEEELFIKEDNNRYYLDYLYHNEIDIAKLLQKIASKDITNYDFQEKISKLEHNLHITYNDDQKKAITSSLNNNITIISGGPGTGKTTIINAIVKLYINQNKLDDREIMEDIALLAPTGRASKKMSTSTGLVASTIHRYLKWNKKVMTL